MKEHGAMVASFLICFQRGIAESFVLDDASYKRPSIQLLSITTALREEYTRGTFKDSAFPCSLPSVMSKKQKAALNLRSGNFVRKDLPLILAALKEDLEKRPHYDSPPHKNGRSSPKHPSTKHSKEVPSSRSEPLFAARDSNGGGGLPLIKVTPEMVEKLKERREQQEAKVYGQLHDQQIESSVDLLNALGGELNSWLATAQAKEAHLERLGMLWRGERDGLSGEATVTRSMKEVKSVLDCFLNLFLLWCFLSLKRCAWGCFGRVQTRIVCMGVRQWPDSRKECESFSRVLISFVIP
jgi:hypothetical protein